MRLKRVAASVVCGALLLTGGGFGRISVNASELDDEQVSSGEADFSEDTEEDFGDTIELEENDNIYGITSAYKKQNAAGVAGVTWLWSSEFFELRSSKLLKKVVCYSESEDNPYPENVEYEYDDKGQVIKINTKSYSYPIGWETYRYENEYYANGDLKCTKLYNPKGDLKYISDFEYEYNKLGQCVKERYYLTDFEEEFGSGKRYLWSTSTYEYDAAGNRIKEDDYYDEIKYYDYDSNGNCIKKSVRNSKGYIERVDEYTPEGYIKTETHYDSAGNKTIGSINDYEFEYDSEGNITEIIDKMHYLDSDQIFTRIYKYEYSSTYVPIKTSGIYCSSTSPSIIAGMVVDNKDNISANIEYQWLVCDESTGNWSVASDWTVNNEWMNYTPAVSGNYIFLCKARMVGSDAEPTTASFGTPFTKTGGIKQICQMPYEGGGYLIGFESFENPNQEYQYEMFVMDLSLLAAGSPTPWVHATGKIKLSAGATPEDGKTMWTIWQPQYGYYLTLFRLYDKDGNMIDEVPYGFANAY